MNNSSRLLFTDTKHCTLQAHCNTCRDRIGGRNFRESMRETFGTPNNEIDFACPFGHPWGYRLPVNFNRTAKILNRANMPFKRPVIGGAVITGCSKCSRKKARAFSIQQQNQKVNT